MIVCHWWGHVLLSESSIFKLFIMADSRYEQWSVWLNRQTVYNQVWPGEFLFFSVHIFENQHGKVCFLDSNHQNPVGPLFLFSFVSFIWLSQFESSSSRFLHPGLVKKLRVPEAFLTPVPTSSSYHSVKCRGARKSESRRRKPKPQKPTIRIHVSSYLTQTSPPHGNLLPCCHGQRETATPDESRCSQSSPLIRWCF